MPGPNEVLQKTGPQIEPIIPVPVGEAGVSPIDEAQVLSNVQSQIADLPHVGGPHTVPETNHEVTTATATPITMPGKEEQTDPKTTHFWNNIFKTKRTEQEEQEGIKDAA